MFSTLYQTKNKEKSSRDVRNIPDFSEWFRVSDESSELRKQIEKRTPLEKIQSAIKK